MALKFPIPFPLFTPQLNPIPNLSQHRRPPGEVRFSRWNNANAEKFEQRRRSQQEIEDELRRERRFESATRIAEIDDTATSSSNIETFKSIGTPSSPSSPSIPGKKSKYSQNPNRNSHPAFRQVSKTKKLSDALKDRPMGVKTNVQLGEDGISYVIDGAPFEFKYSYTETPKVKPIKLREPPYAPFGPTTMPRPWTGRAPLPPSKKKLKEFDSFQLPPANKKGVKPVQAPGPYLAGSGPKYVKSREEILGEPLTVEEIKALVNGCLKSKRQLNMGRDGLTHNMLDNIHALWKRRRVCKIKCKGVCTVDMDNVCEQLEEKTGGKIIYRRGGVLYLFRGRNYNHKTRPRFPLMLWKPVTPVYPRLVQRAPEGLTLEEATEMRKKGRNLIPICKLGKNGVYSNLVRTVREAFEECELVRINCQEMNGTDFRKIGAKLKDLVPCILISFESEHILMWRGHDWKSSFPTLKSIGEGTETNHIDTTTTNASGLDTSHELLASSISPVEENITTDMVSTETKTSESSTSDITGCGYENTEATAEDYGNKIATDVSSEIDSETKSLTSESEIFWDDTDFSEEAKELRVLATRSSKSASPCTEGVLLLLKQAVENGSAVILDDSLLDADIIYQRSVSFAQSAPPEPSFRHQPRKVKVKKIEKEETEDLEVKEVTTDSVKRGSENKGPKTQRKRDFGEHYLHVTPRGSLGIDELAKLLA